MIRMTISTLLTMALSISLSVSANAALFVGKVTNLSKDNPLTLNSISIKSGECQPPEQIPAGKSAFFSITDQQEFLTFVYGYNEKVQDPTKVKGAAGTCVVIMTGNGTYRVSETNPDKVECKISDDDIGGMTVTINQK